MNEPISRPSGPDPGRGPPQLLRRAPAHGFGDALAVPASERADYFVDVRREPEPQPGETGYDLAIARRAAQRIRDRLRPDNGGLLHQLIPERVGRLLG
ncbi:MAG: hypothetical protein KDE27_28490 [Planctomycetes bacterium]|nr:hypothetical protein [Planctomycetota bacterium]